MTDKLIVKLGRNHLALPWMASPEGQCVIGTVSRGAEFGYLAKADDGNFVQVNGSVVQVLNTSQVRDAIRRAARFQGLELEATRDLAPAAVPMVVVRKRRRAMIPEAAMV